jgi:hypothetical protein
MGGSLTGIALKDLLEAGVHFGHQTKRWNPKMKKYIFGERNGIYIIDLAKTAKLFRDAEEFVHNLAAEGKTILFVGTKRQAQDAVADEAQRAGDAETQRAGLAGDAAARDRREHDELICRCGDRQRLPDLGAVRFGGEGLLEGLVIDRQSAGARPEEHAGR